MLRRNVFTIGVVACVLALVPTISSASHYTLVVRNPATESPSMSLRITPSQARW